MPVSSLARQSAQQMLELIPVLMRWSTRCAARAGAHLDLSLRQLSALRAIKQGVDSAGELARRWRVTPAVVTGVLDRLERRGMVRRDVDPGDRRRFHLVVTPAGQAADRALIDDFAAQLVEGLEAGLDGLARALGLMEQVLEQLEAAESRRGETGPARGLPKAHFQSSSRRQSKGRRVKKAVRLAKGEMREQTFSAAAHPTRRGQAGPEGLASKRRRVKG